TLYLHGINKTALQVSEDAKLIDEKLRARSAQDSTKFAGLIEEAEKRDLNPIKSLKSSTGSSWKDKINKMREVYPNAYMPWKSEDNDILKTEFQNGTDIPKLSQKLGRHEGSIKMRL